MLYVSERQVGPHKKKHAKKKCPENDIRKEGMKGQLEISGVHGGIIILNGSGRYSLSR